MRFNEKNRLMTVLPGNAAGMVGVERLQDRFKACVGTMCASLEGLFTRLSLGFFGALGSFEVVSLPCFGHCHQRSF